MRLKRIRELDIDEVLNSAVRAAGQLEKLDQAQTDRIVEAVFRAGYKKRVHLAKLAHRETGLGNWRDKVVKNTIATKNVYEDIKDLKTAGVISRNADIIQIARPIGPLFAVTPITNPTSTVLFKILIALKTRNPIIIRPHGSAKKCSIEAAKITYYAALKAGAPEDCIQWIRHSSIEQTLELMAHRQTALILATGSVSLVHAAYCSGNPAIGVGPGNVPVYIGESADIPFAVEQIMISKTFDHGTVCASEQALVVLRRNADRIIEQFKKHNAYFLSGEEVERVGRIAFNRAQKVMNVEVIGQPPSSIAGMANIDVPRDTTLLIATLTEVGVDSPLSLEILAPILAFYVVETFDDAVDLCHEINRHGGMGHTASIFSSDKREIEQFALSMNVGRVLVNSPASQGAIGGTYNALHPSLMLGCGPSGKNITSDNITAEHLLNIQRVANRRNKRSLCTEK
jgi:acetaldehyde dehydrogenase/alcohol dehydrogenase